MRTCDRPFPNDNGIFIPVLTGFVLFLDENPSARHTEATLPKAARVAVFVHKARILRCFAGFLPEKHVLSRSVPDFRSFFTFFQITC